MIDHNAAERERERLGIEPGSIQVKSTSAKPKTCLEIAGGLVDGERMADYGHPLDDFTKVTGAAKALGIDPAKEGPLHHALYMVLVKLARLVETPDHRDSIVDGPGYFRTYEKILEEQKRRCPQK